MSEEQRHEHKFSYCRSVIRTSDGEDGWIRYARGSEHLECACGRTSVAPRVEYRAVGRSPMRVYRYENGVQVGTPIFAGGTGVATGLARDFNIAVAAGVRLSHDNLCRSAPDVADAIKKFDFSDYGLDNVSFALASDPDSQEWVNDLAKAVIRALGGTCA